MKELMDLLTRLVVAVEGIDRSLAYAGTNAKPAATVGSGNGDARRVPGGGGERHDDRQPLDVKPAQPSTRRMSNASDVSIVSADVLESSRAAMVTFAIDNQKVPWSEAHMRAVMEYEQLVEREYGEGESMKLPWRRVVPRGTEGL